MNDIAKGILTGGWSLVAGWILPTAINALVFGFFVLPSLNSISIAHNLGHTSVGNQALAVLSVTTVGGLVLNALQTPLYRILEGYLLWPAPVARMFCKHHVKVMRILQKRLEAIDIRALDDPTPEEEKRLAALEADPEVSKFIKRDQVRTTVQGALLGERLRYPVDDKQVAPTRLGNAIRRLEDYGFDRYQLDSQALWYELTGAAPDAVSRQVDIARVGVDFFVCLLYGQFLVAVAALASLGASHPQTVTLLVTAATLVLLMPVWYQLAWANTDDWAVAVRALVDLGRKPLAESLGLRLPREFKREREMWLLCSQLVLYPYAASHAARLDKFRYAGATATRLVEFDAGDGLCGSDDQAGEINQEQGGNGNESDASLRLRTRSGSSAARNVSRDPVEAWPGASGGAWTRFRLRIFTFTFLLGIVLRILPSPSLPSQPRLTPPARARHETGMPLPISPPMRATGAINQFVAVIRTLANQPRRSH